MVSTILLSRRRVCKTIAGMLVASPVSTTVAASDSTSVTSETDDTESRHATAASTGVYDGTVDRIVDGDHVVILITSGGETIGQFVEPQSDHPTLEEGDAVTALLFRGTLVHVWPS